MEENLNQETNIRPHEQAFEFSILGIKIKWRAPIIFGMMALSIMLNFYLVFKILGFQKELSTVQEKMYERVITEIKEPMRNINQNIQQTNQRLDAVEKENVEGLNE